MIAQAALFEQPTDETPEYINPVTNREAWLEARGKGIGGSDAGVLMRWNAYKGVGPLWKEKAGLSEDSFETNRWIEWGNLLEPLALHKYAADRKVWVLGRDLGGRPVRFPPDITRPPHYLGTQHPLVRWLNPLVSPSRDYARANVDGFSLGAHGRFIEKGLEVKTTGQDNRPKWNLLPPPSYLAQCLHNRQVMREMGLDVPFDIMALIGGNDFGILPIHEHRDYVAELLRREELFWYHVERVIKPKVRADFPRVPTPSDIEEQEMGFKPPKQDIGGTIPAPDTGTTQGVCCSVVGRGVYESEYNGEKKSAYKFSVHWLLSETIPTHDEDGVEIPEQYAGEPFMVQQWFTSSVHEKSNFRRFLKALRGRDITSEEEKAFNMGEWDLSEELVGRNALLTLSHREKDGKVFADVESVGPLMKGMEAMTVPAQYVGWLPPSMREDEDEDEAEAPAPKAKATVPADPDDDMPF